MKYTTDTGRIKTLTGTFEIQYRSDGFIIIGPWKLSPKFRTIVNTDTGDCYDLTTSQAAIFRRVFEYHEDGCTSVAQSELREYLCDSRFNEDDEDEIKNRRRGPQRLNDSLKTTLLWGTLLVFTKGQGSRVYFDFN